MVAQKSGGDDFGCLFMLNGWKRSRGVAIGFFGPSQLSLGS